MFTDKVANLQSEQSPEESMITKSRSGGLDLSRGTASSMAATKIIHENYEE